MEQSKLPSAHQIKDFVVVKLYPHLLLNCRIEAVKFSESTVHYDVSVKMKQPGVDKVSFTELKDVHSAFVFKKGDDDLNLLPDRKPSLRELQEILQKMDYYHMEEGFIAPVWLGEFAFFGQEPSFGGKSVTKAEVLKMIDEAN